MDSGDYHWRAWRDIMAREGVELTYAQFLETFGQRNDTILAGWLGHDVASDRIKRIGDAKEARYRELARREGLRVLPGAREWVHRLHAAGWRQAIASSAPRENVEVMIAAAGISSEIDALVSAEDVSAGKPDPEVFLVAAARGRTAARRCIVVEDAPAGIEGARRAGMRCIGVSASTLLKGDVFVRTLADLPDDAFDRLLACASGEPSTS